MTGSRFAHIYKEHRSLCLILNLVGSASSVGLFHFQTGSLSWREVEERDVLQTGRGPSKEQSMYLAKRLGSYPQAGGSW